MKKRQIITVIMTLALIISIGLSSAYMAIAATPQQFSDLPSSHWAYASVSELSGLGIIGGYPDGTFGPNNKLTIAECVTLVVRGIIQDNPAIKLAKAASDHWASAYMETAKQRGIFFDSDLVGAQTIGSPATRAQMAVFIDRALDGYNYDEFMYVGITGSMVPELYGFETKFSDVNNAYKSGAVTKKEIVAITHLYMLGLVGGYPDGTYGYGDTITRAETAAIIYRFINQDITEHGVFPEPEVAAETVSESPAG